MKASDLMVRCLENEKVEYIFGLPGEENIDVMESLLDSSIRFIGVRHEQGGAFMADVYGRLTGRAGVCLSTLGPGATNLMTGVADANMDGSPVVAITGQASLDRMHKESHQHIDVVGTFQPITKWNAQITKAAIIPEIVRKAFKVAETEKPGATHIDFPEDVAEEQIDAEPLLPQAPYPWEPPSAQTRPGGQGHLGGEEPHHPGRQRSGEAARVGGADPVRRAPEHPGRRDLHGQGRAA